MKVLPMDLGPEGLDCTEEGKDRGEEGIHGLHGGTVVRI